MYNSLGVTVQLVSLCKIFLFRNDDEYDKAIGTLLSIGASVLKVAGEKMLDFYNSNQVKIQKNL